MQLEVILSLIVIGCFIVGSIVAIIIAIVRGDMKRFIEAKMIEAEQSGMSGKEKLEYVIKAVKDKYKIMEIVLNVKAFVEHIIALSKEINAK